MFVLGRVTQQKQKHLPIYPNGSSDLIHDTPWKINMEPSNHPLRKENDLPNLHDYVPCSSSGVYRFHFMVPKKEGGP